MKIVPIQLPLTAEHLKRTNFVAELSNNLIIPKKDGTSLSQFIIEQRQQERY